MNKNVSAKHLQHGKIEGPVLQANSVEKDRANSVRWSIRSATRDGHDRLESLFDTLDFEHLQHRLQFMLAHALAYHSVEVSLPSGSSIQQAVRQNAALLFDYLDSHGCSATNSNAIDAPRDLGLGAAYVLAGSSMGKRVLAVRWHEKTGKEAPAFFHEKSLPAAWREVMAEMNDMSESDIRLRHVIADAMATFEVFEHGFAMAQEMISAASPVRLESV